MTFVLLYAAGINDACERKDTALQDLLTLREHAYSVLQAQGDLQGALQRLNGEIARRQGK